MNYDVFISYSRKDTPIADKICAALELQGITYFIDRKGIGGGMEFPTVLADAIINCKIMLFLGSNNSYESKFTNNEVTFAFNKKPTGSIVPFIIDGSTLPPALEFTFSSINIRTLQEHPIETTLMKDLCRILGKNYVDIEAAKREQEERKRQEEERKEQERQQQDQELQRKQEELRKQQEEQRKRQEEQQRRKQQEELLKKHKQQKSEAPQEEKEETQEHEIGNGGCLFVIFMVIVAVFLAYKVGDIYHSFWVAAGIFVTISWTTIFVWNGWENHQKYLLIRNDEEREAKQKANIRNSIAYCSMGIIFGLAVAVGLWMESFATGFAIWGVLSFIALFNTNN